MPSKEQIAEANYQHKLNIYSSTLLATAIGYLAGGISMWFLLALVVPAFILWASTTWLIRGGFMFAMVMNKKEQLEEMSRWLEGPIERAIMEKRKNESGSSPS